VSDTNTATDAVVAKLLAAGLRATADSSALNPPAVLVPPPRRVYDQMCGYSAQWNVHALAPAPRGSGDRTVIALLDELVDAVAAVFAVETAQPQAYVLGPNTHPSYLVTFTTTED
jgi:hypothetical protein